MPSKELGYLGLWPKDLNGKQSQIDLPFRGYRLLAVCEVDEQEREAISEDNDLEYCSRRETLVYSHFGIIICTDQIGR